MAGLISAAELCALSGLTDRRHRQLAAAGYFPPPIRGEYKRDAAVAGLFRHLRELIAKKHSELAKEQHLLTKTKRETAQEDLAIKREHYVAKSEIGPALRNLSLHQRAKLQFKLENELAPNLAGLHPLEIRSKLAAAVDEICQLFHDGVKEWMLTPP